MTYAKQALCVVCSECVGLSRVLKFGIGATSSGEIVLACLIRGHCSVFGAASMRFCISPPGIIFKICAVGWVEVLIACGSSVVLGYICVTL